MNATTHTPIVPQAEAPVERIAPATDPLRVAREVVAGIGADARVDTDEYLEEVRVAGGGE